MNFGKFGPPIESNATRAPAPLVIRMTSRTMSTSSVATTCAAPASSNCFDFADARESDWRRARVIGQLDRTQSNTARRGRNDDKVSLSYFGIFDERSIRRHEHHP